MGASWIYIIAFIGFIHVYGQPKTPTVCWDSRWFNDSSPTKTNRSEYEQQAADVLKTVCANGQVIAAQCEDDKGEPFTHFKNDSANQFIATCSVVNGLICNPYNNSKAICADFKIRYGCQCPTTRVKRGGYDPTSSPSLSVNPTGSPTGIGNQATSPNNGGSGTNGGSASGSGGSGSGGSGSGPGSGSGSCSCGNVGNGNNSGSASGSGGSSGNGNNGGSTKGQHQGNGVLRYGVNMILLIICVTLKCLKVID